MGKALYRKYRSKTLDEVVGQEHITTTLKNALETKTFSHAYLFTGPKGVGKTSIARILAHEINKLPYEDETTHLDIIEIDAASNRRIDEIRDLREKVHIAPTSAQYKVYIIDEVHMLTKEAFNALLKTLEEPPAHVIFILATTELSKLPETIVSRTQHFSFKPIGRDDATRHLIAIAKNEGITLNEEAADLIAEHGSGSFRDSISLLDKLKTTDTTIDIDKARSGLGIAPDGIIENLLNEINTGTPRSLITTLNEIYGQGYDSGIVCRQLIKKVKAVYIQSPSPKLLKLYRNLVETTNSFDTTTLLEITLLENQNLSNSPIATDSMEVAPETKQPITVPEPVSETEHVPETTPQPPVKTKPAPMPTPKTETDDSDIWNNVIDEIKKHHNTLYGVLRMAEPVVNNDEIILRFRFPFHYKQINEPKNLKLVTKLAREVSGTDVSVVCELLSKQKAPIIKNDDGIIAINNIFGPSEVLES